MKLRTLSIRGLAVSLFIGVCSCLQLEAAAATADLGSAEAAQPDALASKPPTADEDPAPALAPTGATNDIANAPVTPMAGPAPAAALLPPNIRPSSPVAEVIKLANSGVDQSVMLAFVANSKSTFNLGAEEIIYLNDIGVPGTVVTAMIQRDQTLRTLAANAPPPAPVEAPAPEEVAPQPMNPEPPPVADSSEPAFYNDLAPYGSWVNLEGYGPCWQPTAAVVDVGWQPYFNGGHWVYSDCGWYWLSDYSWGWAPFHYGRWFRHNRLGWCWAPDRVWGPSWVCWSYTDNYCGWAPLPPGAYFSAGFGLSFHGHRAYDGEHFGLGADRFHFVAWSHFNDHRLTHYSVSPRQGAQLFSHSTVATRIIGNGHNVANQGLPVERVAAATHTKVRPAVVRETTGAPRGAGRADVFDPSRNSLTVYRPRVEPATGPTVAQRPGYRALPGPNTAAFSERSTSFSSAQRTESRPWQAQTGQNSPLILRGASPSAGNESAPANSLIVIGKRDAAAGSWANRPAPSAAPATPAPSAPPANSAWQTRLPIAAAAPAQNNSANRPVAPASSAAPWFAPRNNGEALARVEQPTTAWSERSYNRTPAQPAPTAVPRYAPAPTPQRSYQTMPSRQPSFESRPAMSMPGPQRSYSAPSMPSRSPSFESRPAPSSPSAPSGSSSSSHSSPTPSGKNGR